MLHFFKFKVTLSMNDLFDINGQRKYLVPKEREKFAAAARTAEREIMTFCLTLLNTGCRISEALELTPLRFDYPAKCVVIRSLKKRSEKPIYRTVPLSDNFLEDLRLVPDMKKLQKNKELKNEHIWSFVRMTGYRKVMEVMKKAEIEGVHACPKGLRHSFGIYCALKGIPESRIQKWLGHSSRESTIIYTDAVGEEERQLASRLWE
jgi:integrase